jgi:hypothetical protein
MDTNSPVPLDMALAISPASRCPKHRNSQPLNAVDEMALRMQAKSFDFLFVRSDPPKQHKNDNDDQDSTDHTDAAVAIAIAVTASPGSRRAKR